MTRVGEPGCPTCLMISRCSASQASYFAMVDLRLREFVCLGVPDGGNNSAQNPVLRSPLRRVDYDFLHGIGRVLVPEVIGSPTFPVIVRNTLASSAGKVSPRHAMCWSGRMRAKFARYRGGRRASTSDTILRGRSQSTAARFARSISERLHSLTMRRVKSGPKWSYREEPSFIQRWGARLPGEADGR